ncbi:transcriptional repressor [uncultured Campylobacter sp.]|jgi:fe2+/zn2+ uptake regulation proteins|uniref:Fur family transcriptional regulator n=1 Tax=uncultured Campylobacter sp. TaxID=218934 RepID=UPI00261B2737|nr:transcriptional repressor [uncultured Campylobacter sp.]
MRELKYSKQREAIVECLKNRCDHPSADLVFQSLRKDNPKISLGTVYRNLNLLTEMGVILKISCGDGIERYDYNTHEHYHFVCKNCGNVADLEPKESWVDNTLVDESVGVADSHSLIFYGICTECSGKNTH